MPISPSTGSDISFQPGFYVVVAKWVKVGLLSIITEYILYLFEKRVLNSDLVGGGVVLRSMIS